MLGSTLKMGRSPGIISTPQCLWSTEGPVDQANTDPMLTSLGQTVQIVAHMQQKRAPKILEEPGLVTVPSGASGMVEDGSGRRDPEGSCLAARHYGTIDVQVVFAEEAQCGGFYPMPLAGHVFIFGSGLSEVCPGGPT